MKIVKTHSNWTLNKRGYPVAFRFCDHGIAPRSYTTITNWLKENRGPQSHFAWNDDKCQWTTFTGRAKNWREPTPYFIGLKNEADVSAIMLSIGYKL